MMMTIMTMTIVVVVVVIVAEWCMNKKRQHKVKTWRPL